MSDWEFGSDKEVEDAVRSARRQPMTRARFGEYLGGFAGLLIAAGLVLIHFFSIAWPAPDPLNLVLGYLAVCATALFVGAQAGKRLLAKRNEARGNS